MSRHRWSGWPGAICLDCGIEDPVEHCVATDADGAGCVCSIQTEVGGELASPCKVKIPPCTGKLRPPGMVEIHRGPTIPDVLQCGHFFGGRCTDCNQPFCQVQGCEHGFWIPLIVTPTYIASDELPEVRVTCHACYQKKPVTK